MRRPDSIRKETRQKTEWYESVGGGKSQVMQGLAGCVEEPGTREPWRSSEQGKDRVSFVL